MPQHCCCFSFLSKMESLTVATYNVHMWGDADFEDNFDRVLKIVKHQNPDLLCLQEATGEETKEFAKQSSYEYYVSRGGCAIMSKTPFKEHETKRKARSVTAKVELDKGNDLYLTCLHLDHRKEPTRLEQIRAIRQELDNIFTSDHCQIWTGDYNALTKEDYTGQNWQNITDIRARNGWELPQIDVTSRMKKDYGFKDTWAMVGCPRPIKTCRFDTRIDYIYANPKLLSLYDVQNVLHIDDTSSDHNMVKTTFTKKN